MLGGRVAVVWLVTTSSRMVTGEKPSCSLLLTGPEGVSTYTVTSTELNVNFAAESVETTGSGDLLSDRQPSYLAIYTAEHLQIDAD